MGVNYQIPHTAHYFTKTHIFTGTFNVPTIGVYDFGSVASPVAGNVNQSVTELQKNKVYLIDRISIGGNIAESDYLDSINLLPDFRLKYKISGENVYFLPYSVVNYLKDSQVTAWVLSEKGGEELFVNFYGILDQIPATIGKLTIKIHLTFSIFIISSTVFYGKFRDALSSQTGDQASGSLDGSNLVFEIRELTRLLRERIR